MNVQVSYAVKTVVVLLATIFLNGGIVNATNHLDDLFNDDFFGDIDFEPTQTFPATTQAVVDTVTPDDYVIDSLLYQSTADTPVAEQYVPEGVTVPLLGAADNSLFTVGPMSIPVVFFRPISVSSHSFSVPNLSQQTTQQSTTSPLVVAQQQTQRSLDPADNFEKEYGLLLDDLIQSQQQNTSNDLVEDVFDGLSGGQQSNENISMYQAELQSCSVRSIPNVVLKSEDVRREVIILQRFLNCSTYTQLGTVGPGTPGQETNVFSSETVESVKKFQQLFASEILAPLELTEPTGIWGERSIKKANDLLEGK